MTQDCMADMEVFRRAVMPLVVTADNPASSTNGMDYERCAALHNAIYKHGWVRSGRNADDFAQQSRPWLELHPVTAGDRGYHASVVEFLRRARSVIQSYKVNFAYQFWGPAPTLGDRDYAFPDDDQTVGLYSSHMAHCSQPDGLVYDQATHKAIVHFDVTDELIPEQPWQPLESIRIVWAEMILRGKIAALPEKVGKTEYEVTSDGSWHAIVGPASDPLTGARRLNEGMEPWTIVPFSEQDLLDALEMWNGIVDIFEGKMSLPAHKEPTALLFLETLRSAHVPEGFASQFLTKARKPRFLFVAPGLRIPQDEDFVSSPYLGDEWITESEDHIPPILLFRGTGTVPTDELDWYGYRPSREGKETPSGLYLHPCDRTQPYPQEDGCKLILPYQLSGAAKMTDLSPAHGYDKLLQAGMDPYNIGHPVQLQAFLVTVRSNIESGLWDVDEHGIAGGIEKWREADTEEHWSDYFIISGPEGIW